VNPSLVNLALPSLLNVVFVVVLVLVLDKEPSAYDDKNEDEYDPLNLALMTALNVRPPFSSALARQSGAW
jgi:hypothetical protein